VYFTGVRLQVALRNRLLKLTEQQTELEARSKETKAILDTARTAGYDTKLTLNQYVSV